MALTIETSIDTVAVMEGESDDVESKDTVRRSSPPPSVVKEGRGRRIRARGSEQDSAYFSSGGLQAPVPRLIAKARARATVQHKEVDDETFVPPSLPKAQGLPTLTQALHFVDQVRKVNSGQTAEGGEELHGLAEGLRKAAIAGKEQEFQLAGWQEEEDRWCVAVSLRDGLVQHSTDSLGLHLGYPPDLWVGRSFMDFLHLEDRQSFSNHVSENIHLEQEGGSKNCVSARVRVYNSLTSGFSVKGRKTQYKPYKLSVCFWGSESEPVSQYMFITGAPIHCAYSSALELGPVAVKDQTSFTTQQKADCTITWIDDLVTNFTGFLTHQLQGRSILQLIHPYDLSILKDIFKKLVSKRGKPSNSKGIRMRTKNNCYISLNSTWSSFINPWTKHLEFVMGKHTVLLGPDTTDDFFSGSLDTRQVQGLSMAGQMIQEDIRKCLTKPLAVSPTESINRLNLPTVTGSRQEQFMETIMGNMLDVNKRKHSNPPAVRPQNLEPKLQGYNMSNNMSSCSDSPPDYIQLNYKENITRYFNSQPQTYTKTKTKENFFPEIDMTSESGGASAKVNSREVDRRNGSGKRKSDSSGSGSGSGSGGGYTREVEAANSSSLRVGLCAGDARGEDGMCSQNGSSAEPGEGTGTGDGYSHPALTQEMMALHNKDMEANMQQQYMSAKTTSERHAERLARAVEKKKQMLMLMPVVLLPTSGCSPPAAPPGYLQHQVTTSNLPEDSDSSALYTYLPTSSDMITLPSSSSSSGARKTQKSASPPCPRSRPVLQEPFWNQRVTLTQEQSYLYQLPEADVEVVLASDAEHLALLQQHGEVEEQLETLLKEMQHEDIDISNLLMSFPDESFDEDSAWCHSSNEGDTPMKCTRQTCKEMVNIFMEVDAPLSDTSSEEMGPD